jgi:hypothetical protein
MKTIKELYKLSCDGDRLTTPELLKLNTHFHDMAKLLFQCGDTFVLAAREAAAIAYRTDDYIAFRRDIGKLENTNV